ncbi:MAG: hypothetical protein C0603_10825 [Denitrovibrio sp.]|nr:MAG: hypothetical protein C0603_10825 [Denitrovibrio sp.]
MSHYKHIQIFCNEEIDNQLTNMINFPSLKTQSSKDKDDLLGVLESKDVDAVIISAELSDDYIIRSILDLNILVAVVVDEQNFNAINNLLSLGITTFFPSNGLEACIGSFIDTVLLNTTKSNILLKSLRRLRYLASNATDGIIIFDDNEKLSFINKSAERILGVYRSEVLRKGLDAIFKKHPFVLDCNDQKPFSVENYTFTTIADREIIMSSTCSANYEKDKFAGAVLIFSKISTGAMDRQKELELLQYQERYHSGQQNMAFKKQMLVMKDELSNTLAGQFAVETYFKPLDVLSGDLYGSINIKDGRYLFYVIDAMGKGLSASVTALQSSSFINHSLELSILKNDFDMKRTLSSFLNYIRDRLMEEEALCVAFALLDTEKETLTISNYGMPPIYFVGKHNKIEIVRPNNLPIMRCIAQNNTDTYSLRNVDKFLLLSDGLTELSTTEGGLYMDHLAEDLLKSETKKHFLAHINKITNLNEDDITFFFIKRLNLEGFITRSYSMKTDTREITTISSKLCEQMEKDMIPADDIGIIEFGLSEIIMNAVEHGNIGLNCNDKQLLISNGEYDSFISEKTKIGYPIRDQNIQIDYYIKKPKNGKTGILCITIQDEGTGFVPASLFKYHSFDGNLCHVDRENYNGRGIFITDNLVDGLYYNEKGNCAYLLKLINP